MKIDKKISIENDFRFCQLSLWGAQLEAIKTTTCKFLTNNILNIGGLTDKINLGGLLPGDNSNSRRPGIFGL